MTPESLPGSLRQLLDRSPAPRPWRDGHKIPWHEPEFSRRVLAVHLDPDTHMASRAPEVIDAHVAWLRELISAEPAPADRPVHVLDLGCGPGLYALPLAREGLQVTGIDFGPAAVSHAQRLLDEAGCAARAAIIQADLTQLPRDLVRQLAPADVTTFWFAEFHGFAADAAQRILDDAAAMTRPGGLLVLETMPLDLFARDQETSWSLHRRSVFSDRPHLWLQEHHWHEDDLAEITVHWILDVDDGSLARYSQCHQAYTDDQLAAMVDAAGFTPQDLYPPITGVDEQLEFPVLVARRR